MTEQPSYQVHPTEVTHFIFGKFLRRRSMPSDVKQPAGFIQRADVAVVYFNNDSILACRLFPFRYADGTPLFYSAFVNLHNDAKLIFKSYPR